MPNNLLKKQIILYVVTEDWYFLSHRLNLAKQMLDKGYEVHVATNKGEKEQEIKSNGFIYHTVTFYRGSINPIRDSETINQLRKLYSKIHPNIVHHVSIKPVVLGSLAAIGLKEIGIVNAITGLGYAFIETTLKAKIAKTIIRLALRFSLKHLNYYMIFQNPDDQQIFNMLNISDEERSVIIYGSGVNTDTFTPLPTFQLNNPLKFLFPSRLLWNKGIRELVEASATLKGRGIKFELIVAGKVDKGNPTCVDERTVLEWEEQGLIHWIGHRSDLNKILQSIDVVVLPSYREGSPLALIEAASCGKPIITTNVTGCREVVIENYNGILVEKQNVTQLSMAIEKLIENTHLLKIFANNSRKLAIEKFAQELVISKTLNIYTHFSLRNHRKRIRPND